MKDEANKPVWQIDPTNIVQITIWAMRGPIKLMQFAVFWKRPWTERQVFLSHWLALSLHWVALGWVATQCALFAILLLGAYVAISMVMDYAEEAWDDLEKASPENWSSMPPYRKLASVAAAVAKRIFLS